ncbi:hypothetical protein [uncultured Gimesia sp.]|uniref:hypothetical protein n=1 Tax=uncultured Gimesia sp. TaxID=1678688 RepID=UPI0026274333|nr:hypothetical protein [uncultured Gimesia sp.]
MPIKVRCKECNTSFSVKDEAEGKRVRCKGCGAPVRVSKGPKKKRSPSGKAEDTDDFLTSFDISKIEDEGAKICPRCGNDVDEEDIECSNCGVELTTGRMTEATRKKRKRKGPAVEEFYKKSWGDAYTFLGNHTGLVMKTFIYSIISSTLFFCSVFMSLWCHQGPPRAFWSFLAFVSIMAIPGWIWFMQTEVVRFALQKKAKLKRINFDFFLCSALGIKFISWFILFSLPAQAIFGTLGYYYISNDSILVGAILIAIGFIPTFIMFPLAMPHMTMVDTTPGWMPHKLGKIFLGLAKPALFCGMVFLLTNLPAIGCLAGIGAVSGNDLNTFFSNVRFNSAVAADEQAKVYAEENKIKDFQPGKLVGEKPEVLDAKVLIIPSVLWLFTCIFYAPAMIYNARVNGLMALHSKPDLDLITKTEDLKYVSKSDRKNSNAMNSPGQIALIGVLGGIGVWLFNFVILIAFTSVCLALNLPAILFVIGLAMILFTPPLIAVVCWIISLIELGKKDGAGHCILGVVFFPYAYGKGWTYIRKNKLMGKVMLTWTLMFSFYFFALIINFMFNTPIPGSQQPDNAPQAAVAPADPAAGDVPADPAAADGMPADPAAVDPAAVDPAAGGPAVP